MPVGALATRLVAIGGLFTLAVLLEVGGRVPYSERQLIALYAVVLAGFLSTLGYGLIAAYGRGRHLVLLELAADGVLITGLVYCTGGPRSVFGFVYIAWIVYAALRAGSLGTAVAPVAAALGYALVNWGVSAGWLPSLELADRVPLRETLADIGTHTVAFVLVAGLSQRLARQIKRGQEQLHELGELHRRIVDNVSSGLLTVDQAGRITSFNREAERITGFSSRELVGARLEERLPEISAAISGDQTAGEREGSVESDLSRLRICFENRHGERLHLGLSRSSLRDALGRPEGSVLIFQDLTRVAQMEEELRRSERLAAVGQLAAGLAHEVRNPLGSLSGAIELLARELPELGKDSRRLIRIVQRENARLNRLVSDFLSYARPGRLGRERCSLNELFSELQELLRAGGHWAAKVDLDLAPALDVCGDPDALRQVFWNLVLNAVDAGSEDDVVRIRARPGTDAEAGSVRVEVIDRGAGIAPELVDRIFEPFFTTRAKGTGLGLATVHRLVEGHGGSLQVTSEVGAGTTVSVVLPSIGS